MLTTTSAVFGLNRMVDPRRQPISRMVDPQCQPLLATTIAWFDLIRMVDPQCQSLLATTIAWFDLIRMVDPQCRPLLATTSRMTARWLQRWRILLRRIRCALA